MDGILIGKTISVFATAGTVLDLTSKISNHINFLSHENHDKIKKCLKKLDLKAKLECVESVVRQCVKYRLKEENKHDLKQRLDTSTQNCIPVATQPEIFVATNDANIKTTDSIDLTLSIVDEYIKTTQQTAIKYQNPIDVHVDYLHGIIKDIYMEFIKIRNEIREHKNKYFSGYRSLDVDLSLSNLEEYDFLLKQRYDRFITIVNMEFMYEKTICPPAQK